MEPTTSYAHAASARILLYLHSVDETGGSSSCEDVMVNEMTSLDDVRKKKKHLEIFVFDQFFEFFRIYDRNR